MKKILFSVAAIGLVAAVAIGATTAYFSDTETSTGNTFTAGSIDLKVDSTSHYNGFICVDNASKEIPYVWEAENGTEVTDNTYPQPGDPCDGTWEETDLEEGIHKFFNFGDLKPGDYGEDTVSLHVYDNDAWGRFVITNYIDSDNGCTEPELEAEADCTDDGDGELDDAMDMDVWLDQGEIPGFQNIQPIGDGEYEDTQMDPTEGDNIWQNGEPEVNIDEIIDPTTGAVTYSLWETFTDAYSQYRCSTEDGHNDYGPCHGLALDGRMVGSTTYYFGIEWNIPAGTGNKVQSDKLESDLSFEVVQHRNNPNQTF